MFSVIGGKSFVVEAVELCAYYHYLISFLSFHPEDGNETMCTYIRTTYGGVRLGCHVITLTNGMDLLITAAVLLQ